MFFHFVYALTVVAVVISIIYFILIASFSYGWMRTKINSASNSTVSIAVIVSARNEEENIEKCIVSILAQSYPKENFEVFIVDDSSSDKTVSIVEKFCKANSNVRLLKLGEWNLEGKKNAIATAIGTTTAELIVTTDADCEAGTKWLETIAGFYTETNPKMIVGPVFFHNEQTFFEKMQSLELMALMGSTAGSLHYKRAIMCNGANLAYPRCVFQEVNGFEGIDGQPTGDDVLLMYKINKKYPGGVKFNKNADSIVFTSARSTVSEFVQQRKRWASKRFNSLNSETKLVSVIVFLHCITLLLLGIFGGLGSIKSSIYLPFLEICLILGGIKCIIDFLLLFLAASFFQRRKLLYLILPEQVMYLIYVVFIALIGSSGKYEWKGRKVK